MTYLCPQSIDATATALRTHWALVLPRREFGEATPQTQRLGAFRGHSVYRLHGGTLDADVGTVEYLHLF
jgi:hypothetical protein